MKEIIEPALVIMLIALIIICGVLGALLSADDANDAKRGYFESEGQLYRVVPCADNECIVEGQIVTYQPQTQENQND